jgi:hypothetical protein
MAAKRDQIPIMHVNQGQLYLIGSSGGKQVMAFSGKQTCDGFVGPLRSG